MKPDENKCRPGKDKVYSEKEKLLFQVKVSGMVLLGFALSLLIWLVGGLVGCILLFNIRQNGVCSHFAKGALSFGLQCGLFTTPQL